MRKLNSYLCFFFSLSVSQSRKSSSECVNLVGTLSVRWISKTLKVRGLDTWYSEEVKFVGIERILYFTFLLQGMITEWVCCEVKVAQLCVNSPG